MNIRYFWQNCEISFELEIRNLIFSNYVFSRPSISSVIRLSNNIIIFTETILKITKKFVETFFLEATVQLNSFENIVKVAKIDSCEIFDKA